LDLEVPPPMKAEVSLPIMLTLEDVQRNTTKWVTDCLPLRLLSSKATEEELEDVNSSLLDTEVFQLIGLLAHLLYWLTLGVNRPSGEQCLTEEARSSLFAAAHELWCRFELDHRDTATGVSFALPVLLLTIKRGVERCFEVQYPTLVASTLLRQELIDRINSLTMQLFDPDGTYARLGKFDGTGKAIALSKNLEMMTSARNKKAKRLRDLTQRSTPLVRAVAGGAPPPGALARPSRDASGHNVLMKAAMVRLQMAPRGAASASTQPQSACRGSSVGRRLPPLGGFPSSSAASSSARTSPPNTAR